MSRPGRSNSGTEADVGSGAQIIGSGLRHGLVAIGLTILGLAASGCTHQVSQPISIDDALSRELAGAPKNPPSLEALQEIPAVKDGHTGVEGMPEVRVTALRSAAQSFGARGGLAWRRSEERRAGKAGVSPCRS